MELINRTDAIKAMDELEQEDIEKYGCSIPEGFDGGRARLAICLLPTIQAVPIEVLQEIRREIEQEISHWNKRIEPLKGDDLSIHNTKPLSFQENSVSIRNPKEVEYIRYSNRIDGLEKALEFIDTQIKEYTNERDN